MTNPTASTTMTDDDLLAAVLRAPDYPQWRAMAEASGGCARPVRLTGCSTILDRDGAVLIERGGQILAPCGNRRESVCPACSDRYAGDAFHLLRAGLAGGDKDVPTTVIDKPRTFLTLTAPSFGPVHTRRLTARERVIPCGCRDRHHPDDPRIGTAVDPESYDYVGAVLWQAHAGQLWHRFVIALRRALAAELGVRAREFRHVARLSYAKVAEYQRARARALPRRPARRRPRRTSRSNTCRADRRRPAGSDHHRRDRRHHHRHPAGRGTARTRLGQPARPARDPRRPGRRPRERRRHDQRGRLSGYIAKYATKGTGTTDGADRPVRDGAHIAYLDISAHHRRMIETCWQLGDLPQYAELGLRRWAHMLGFRGHFLTKSQRYSTTFRAIRGERRDWRLRAELDRLDAATWGETGTPIDVTTVTVLNNWRLLGVGHRNHAEQELAMAIAERNRQHRTTTTLRRTA